MEFQHSVVSAPLQLGESKPPEHLPVSSGNVRLLPLQHREGLENQYPLPTSAGGRITPQFPVPSLKLGSNDGPRHASESKVRRQMFKAPRTKFNDPDRPYLYHPKYLEYRSRPRQELGKDGRPIWPDHIEAAFQDGKMCRSLRLDIHGLTIHSAGSHQAHGQKEMFPTRKAIWTEHAHY